jgi:hypothetical protein
VREAENLPPYSADVKKSRSRNSPRPLWACMACNECALPLLPCVIRRIRRNQQYALIVPLLYSTCWLLHVSAAACHHQGTYWILLSYVKYKRRGGISKIYNRYRICYRILFIFSIYTFYTIFHSLYIILLLRHSICFILYDMLHILILYLLYILDIPPFRLYSQVTQEDPISSLMMAGY